MSHPKVEFDASLSTNLKTHANELNARLNNVSVSSMMWPSRNPLEGMALSISATVTSRKIIPITKELDVQAAFKDIHIPKDTLLVQINPLIYPHGSEPFSVSVTFQFLESKVQTLGFVELINLMTATANKLQNLVNSL